MMNREHVVARNGRGLVWVGLALLLVAGCFEEGGATPSTSPDATTSEDAESEPLNCPANETPGLVNFEPACVCGNEPHCTDGQSCDYLESGRLTCQTPIPTGHVGCDVDHEECAQGDMCIHGHDGTGGNTCMRLCETKDYLCNDGSYCVGLSEMSYMAPFDGVCNTGGVFMVGQECTNHLQCVPEAFCISQPDGGSECMYPCRVGANDCPNWLTCVELIGETVLGCCM